MKDIAIRSLVLIEKRKHWLIGTPVRGPSKESYHSVLGRCSVQFTEHIVHNPNIVDIDCQKYLDTERPCGGLGQSSCNGQHHLACPSSVDPPKAFCHAQVRMLASRRELKFNAPCWAVLGILIGSWIVRSPVGQSF